MNGESEKKKEIRKVGRLVEFQSLYSLFFFFFFIVPRYDFLDGRIDNCWAMDEEGQRGKFSSLLTFSSHLCSLSVCLCVSVSIRCMI